ncbi:GFA family protein [uncultured Thalassospira sp.]|uniref:GFA family protein n=1 Tax=uncultured Thalassospira sp. TaxID=404382 RepID=UPI0025892185|nr:GFA family protein [uncultured Thalassospira sp.]
MTEKHHGSCQCGAVTFEVTGRFDSFFLCHCQYCRKDTGSAYAANLFSRQAKLDWRSGRDKVVTYTVPDTRHEKSFCQTCGAAVPRQQFGGRLVVVPAGCLDSDVIKRPDAHIMLGSKAGWDDDLHEIGRLDGLPE